MNRIEEIREIATDVRKAIDMVVAHNEIPLGFTPFDNFPNGCCGSMSKILTSHFESFGFQNVGYMSGRHFDGGRGHAWIIINEICVDITADQFVDMNYPPVIVLPENEYELRNIFLNDHPAQRLGMEGNSDLLEAYEYISKYLKVLN